MSLHQAALCALCCCFQASLRACCMIPGVEARLLWAGAWGHLALYNCRGSAQGRHTTESCFIKLLATRLVTAVMAQASHASCQPFSVHRNSRMLHTARDWQPFSLSFAWGSWEITPVEGARKLRHELEPFYLSLAWESRQITIRATWGTYVVRFCSALSHMSRPVGWSASVVA